MTRREEARLQQLEAFLDEHESMLATALLVYAERMRGDAEPLERRYEEIEDDPAARAAQDNSWITTEGLRLTAGMFRDSADRADRTRAALNQVLEEGEGT